MMKTSLLQTFKGLKLSLLTLLMCFHGLLILAQPNSGSNGLNFDNNTLLSGNPLEVGAKYLFSNVDNNTDAIVTIDSLVNGAKVNKIDDNSNGVGYKQAFQPAIQSGGVIGFSYAVFSIQFVEHGSMTPKTLQTVNATALDLDGNNSLKEMARIGMGNGSLMNFQMASPDISVTQPLPGEFLGLNVLGVERNGIDTSSLANMFTATNHAIAGFTVKYGTFTSSSSSSVRQFSLYMKGFAYPSSTLPVKMASFTATLNNNNKADLKWTTASEINVSHFVIERSIDGINFSDAGIVFAAGNTSANMNYSFTDNLSAVGATVIWYRLRSVDMDEKTELSATKMIRIGTKSEATISLTVFPNPVKQDLRVTIPASWQNKKLVYEMIAISGQVVSRIQSVSSNQTETLNLQSLASGIYYVRVACEGQMLQQKIVKQ